MTENNTETTKLKAIVFDLDGTLYESRHFPLRLILSNPLHIGYLAAERKCRKKLKTKQFSSAEEYYGELFLIMAGGSEAKAGKCRKWFNDIYIPSQIRIIGKNFGPRPHLQELLSRLKDDYKIGVLSDYGFVNEKLKACGLNADFFDLTRESPELGGLKPNKIVFERFCRQLGVAPSDALMIGDKVSSDGGSLDAGMQFIHIIGNENDRACPKNRSSDNDMVNCSDEKDLTDNRKYQTAATAIHTRQDKRFRDMTWDELLEYFGV